MASALAETDNSALNETVTVYFVRNESAPADAGRAATLAMEYTPESEDTQVLSVNFNGYGPGNSVGSRCMSFFIRENQSLRMLIVRGGDIGDISLQGYEDGGCRPGEELAGVTAELERAEMSLYEALEIAARDYYDSRVEVMFDTPISYPFELYFAALQDAFVSYYGAMERYADGRLDDLLSDTVSYDRVFYLSFELNIPAGGSVAVSAQYKKAASYDFHCGGSENQGLNGYDLLSTGGSSLPFSSQTASVDTRGLVEIVGQNFGFDPEEGITSVTLDPETKHYYLEVRELA